MQEEAKKKRRDELRKLGTLNMNNEFDGHDGLYHNCEENNHMIQILQNSIKTKDDIDDLFEQHYESDDIGNISDEVYVKEKDHTKEEEDSNNINKNINDLQN